MLGLRLTQLALETRIVCQDEARVAELAAIFAGEGFPTIPIGTRTADLFPFPDETFMWAFAIIPPAQVGLLEDAAGEVARVMKTGGWIWVARPVDSGDTLLQPHGFVPASQRTLVAGTSYATRILRKVNADTPI